MKIYHDFSEITQIKMCIARVFDDHRSCQKLINYITNTKVISKRYYWIQKLFVQNFRKRSRCLEENPVFLFGVTNNRVYNDAFRTFTFSMRQSVSFTYQLPYDLNNQDNSFNLRFQIGNGRQSKRLLSNLGRILLFHYFFFFIKTGIRDFLLDIYSAYESFVRTVSGSNNIVSWLFRSYGSWYVNDTLCRIEKVNVRNASL
jgi:hypothetical protein